MLGKKKVFVCYNHEKDKAYFDMLESWCCEEKINFIYQNVIQDALNSPQVLVARMKNTIEKMRNINAFIILVSENTKNLNNSMLIEVNTALNLDIPVIAVNVNGLRYIDGNNCPFILRDKHVLHISFNSKIIEKAIEAWPIYYNNHKEDEEKGPRYFKDTVYAELGIE